MTDDPVKFKFTVGDPVLICENYAGEITGMRYRKKKHQYMVKTFDGSNETELWLDEHVLKPRKVEDADHH